MDPAEWAAKLEDRFYNNNAFKATGVLNQPIVYKLRLLPYKCFLSLSTPLSVYLPLYFCCYLFFFHPNASPEKEPATEVAFYK